MLAGSGGWCWHGILAAVMFLASDLGAVAADQAGVENQTMAEDFDRTDGKLPGGWSAGLGTWSVVDGALVADGKKGIGLVTFGSSSWQNYELEATATFFEVEDGAWLGLVVRAESGRVPTWAQFTLHQKTSRRDGVQFALRMQDAWTIRQQFGAKFDCPIGRPIRVRAVVRNTTVEGYVQGKHAIDSPFCLEIASGRPGFSACGCRVRFDNVKLRRLPDTPAQASIEPKPCEVVAHRGFSQIAPENTLISAQKAIEVGANGSECDVHRTKDGELVISHDEDVGRTTNGSGKITELTLAEIRKLDAGSWKGKVYAGQRVPTLKEMLELLKDTGCMSVVEVKMEGISDKVVRAIREAGMLRQTCVIAFSERVVKEVRQLAPELRCAWLFGEMMDGTPAERAERLARECRACGTDTLDVSYHLASPELVQELKQRGIHVWVWTVDDPVLMRALSEWGVESITTNRPDVALEQLPHVARSK